MPGQTDSHWQAGTQGEARKPEGNSSRETGLQGASRLRTIWSDARRFRGRERKKQDAST